MNISNIIKFREGERRRSGNDPFSITIPMRKIAVVLVKDNINEERAVTIRYIPLIHCFSMLSASLKRSTK